MRTQQEWVYAVYRDPGAGADRREVLATRVDPGSALMGLPLPWSWRS